MTEQAYTVADCDLQTALIACDPAELLEVLDCEDDESPESERLCRWLMRMTVNELDRRHDGKTAYYPEINLADYDGKGLMAALNESYSWQVRAEYKSEAVREFAAAVTRAVESYIAERLDC